ncbi:cob(I)yrinic acid a,c-diamide adenosyltransferase [Pallidibacillus pasinlerensis]|uniref:Corrinoid adenosyltransferase n=1 Tax=Pallidibacillus pasinlerensis TaxID=2703818 RepID=A0ABX0A6G7_9BACI|nr:cob(I)yrinic acid a,c-diamide adenosyltransferase [Pallidibacillus pasinlerensis]NCU19054.1 cob(I)yrinic acid a,c-diamide adenosyltransferase [Pallidibacillus pasinlerensis]
MRIYTRSGDKGTTSLVYGVRVAKNDPRVEAYGTCDEANSYIGLATSFLQKEKFAEKDQLLYIFHKVQTILFHVGAELSTPEGKEVKWKLEEAHIKELEETIDQLDSNLSTLNNFILPGGHPAGASLHVARTIVRRAERTATSIEQVNPFVLAYLNRLSDFLFVAARFVNEKLNGKEKNLHEE